MMSRVSVIAVRIYYGVNFTPMADLYMSDGVTEHIQWTDVDARKEFVPLMTGYTLFYDERDKVPFERLQCGS